MDPNPANFLVYLKKKQIILSDFGVIRSYSVDFVENHIKMIKLATSRSESDNNKTIH